MGIYDKIKVFIAALWANPRKVLANLMFMLDHSKRGFSIKKVTFLYMILVPVTALYYAYIRYSLTLGNFQYFREVLGLTLTWTGYLININFKQEKDLNSPGK